MLYIHGSKDEGEQTKPVELQFETFADQEAIWLGKLCCQLAKELSVEDILLVVSGYLILFIEIHGG